MTNLYAKDHTQAQCKESEKVKNILFVHYGEEWIRGSERCLIDLISHLDKKKYRAIVWCNNKALANELKDMRIPTLCTPFHVLMGWNSPKFDFRSTIKQINMGKKIIRQYDIDLVHTNSAAPNQWMVPAARLCKCPLVAHIHSPYTFRDRLSLGLHFAPLTVAVSQAVIKPFLSDGRSKDDTKVIYNGIDLKPFEENPPINVRQTYNFAYDDFVIACIGSLIYRKGVDRVIQGFNGLLKKGAQAKLLIIGDGKEKKYLIEQAKTLGIYEHILFLGEHKNVAQLLTGGIDLVVSGAREEAFGLVLAEAGAAKIPVVAPRIDGIPEVIIDKISGVLFDSEQPKELENALFHLYQNQSLRKEMGLCGYNRVKTQFTIEMNAAQFCELYDKAIRHTIYKSHTSIFKTSEIALLKLISTSAQKVPFIKPKNDLNHHVMGGHYAK